MQRKVSPAALPAIDEVEIVDLSNLDPNRVDQYMLAAKGAASVRFVDAEAAKIAQLFRELPAGLQARCHMPPFGFRFYLQKRLLCEVSICWKFSNIHGFLGETPLFQEFDADSKQSRELLSLCEQAFKH